MTEEKKPEEKKDTVRLRFRREATVEGKTYLGGSTAEVPLEEAEELIDSGAADMDPPPGVGGQPNWPPEGGAKKKASAPGEAPKGPTPPPPRR
jgi:hypothetical protein